MVRVEEIKRLVTKQSVCKECGNTTLRLFSCKDPNGMRIETVKGCHRVWGHCDECGADYDYIELLHDLEEIIDMVKEDVVWIAKV